MTHGHRSNEIARALVAPGKGILAADESSGTIKKRFDSIGCESTEDRRRAYREMLFTTAGASDYISGVILFDETIRQQASDGRPLAEDPRGAGHHPRHQGRQGHDAARRTRPASSSPTVSTACAQRLVEYRELGAQFAKWRAVIDIGAGIPSQYCIDVNAHALARYAALCQDEGIVPIVEPEVLMDGDHSIERCYEVTTADAAHGLRRSCTTQRVELEGMLLKPNMVIPGKKYAGGKARAGGGRRRDDRVASATIVPAAVPGIVFLSGGQSDEEATANLDAINKIGPHPWQVSFSYGRALQAAALSAWKGEDANAGAGQKAYLHRARMNGLAQAGNWSADAERAAS